MDGHGRQRSRSRWMVGLAIMVAAIGGGSAAAAPVMALPGLPPVCVFGCPAPTPAPNPNPGPNPAPTPAPSPAPLPPPDNAIPNCRNGLRVAHTTPAAPSARRHALGEHASLRYYSGRGLCRRASLARNTGVGYVREDANWSDVQSRRGTWDWRRLDAVFGVAAQYGMTVLPVLDGPPSWAGPVHQALPTDAAAFASFTARAVARYGPGGSFWSRHPKLPLRPARHFELFNEPYYPEFSAGHPSAVQYASLVATAVAAGRNANPAARFLIAGERTYSPDGGHTFRDWMADMYAAVPGFGRFFDGVAVHPYSDMRPPTFYDPRSDVLQARRLEHIRATMAAHGDGAKHLWVTEIGWPTCPRGCVTEGQQASDLRSFFHLSRTRWRRYVDAVFVYSLQDYATRSGREGYYGLLRRNGAPKPAWAALRAAARRR